MIGARVIYINEQNDCVHNKIGKLLKIKNNQEFGFLVEFDENVSGHDGRGLGENGHCWWCKKEYIHLINPYERIN